MKKNLIAASFAAIAGIAGIAHASEPLRIVFAPGIAVTPVAIAAENLPSVEFVAVAQDKIVLELLNNADCGVMSTRDAVRLHELTNNQVKIVSGLSLDKSRERDQQRSALACRTSDDSGTLTMLSGNLITTLRVWNRGLSDVEAAGLADRAIKRTYMQTDAAALAERMAAPRNANNGVAFSYLPRDVMYSAGIEKLDTITSASDLLTGDLRESLRRDGKVAY